MIVVDVDDRNADWRDTIDVLLYICEDPWYVSPATNGATQERQTWKTQQERITPILANPWLWLWFRRMYETGRTEKSVKMEGDAFLKRDRIRSDDGRFGER